MIADKGIRATRWEAWSHYRLQQTDAAREAFERILREDPLDQDAQVGLAYCALSEKKLPEAADRFTLALSRDPDDVGAIEGLAHVRYRQSDPAAAKVLFERAATFNPKNIETRQMLQRLEASSAAAAIN